MHNEKYQNEFYGYYIIIWAAIFCAVFIGAIINQRSLSTGPPQSAFAGVESEDGVRRTNIEVGKEPPSSLTGRKAEATVIGCWMFSIAVWFYVFLRKRKKWHQ